MTTSRIIAAATGLPVTLTDVKTDLGIYHDEKDSTIVTLLEASVSFAERFTGQIFRYPGETMVQTVADFSTVELDYSPVTGVTEVTYYNGANQETTLPTGSYTVMNAQIPAQIEFSSTPVTYNRPDAVKIQYVAGYTTPQSVPADVRTAIMLTVRHLYESSGNPVKQMPTTAEWLLRNHKVH